MPPLAAPEVDARLTPMLLALWVAACAPPTGGVATTGLAAPFAVVVTFATTLALLHLLLYLFEPRGRANLFLAALAAAFALVAFLDYRERVGEAVVLPGVGELQRWAVSALILTIFRATCSLFDRPSPRRFWLYASIIGILLLVAIPRPDLFGVPAAILGLTVTLDALQIIVRGWGRLERGAWVVGVGSVVFAVSGLLQLGSDLVGADHEADGLSPYLWGGLSLLLAVSIYLARTFAGTRRELEGRLVEIEALSAKSLAQEKAAREEEVRRRLVEAENERRGEELEEARRLQLAMLPRELPRVAGFEMAARMATATEVGGDYYDAAIGRRGELWLAVGDAVGHGARAGALVAVAKGLFNGIAAEDSPVAALASFDAALRGMDLRRAHLALAIARLDGAAVELAAAGMPPALVRRAGGRVEEVDFRSLPLGAPLRQEYAARRVELGAGDLLLLLSDGLVELPDGDGAPIGYRAVRRAVAAAPEPAAGRVASWVDELVDGLIAGAKPPDDVTVVALGAL